MLENQIEEIKGRLLLIDVKIVELQSERSRTLESVRRFYIENIKNGLEPHIGLINYLEVAGEMNHPFYQRGPLRDIVFNSATEYWNRRTNVDVIKHLTLGLFSAKGEEGEIKAWAYPDNYIPSHLPPLEQIGSYWNNLVPKNRMIELAIHLIENDIGYIYYDW